jgi:hypothetical protein
MGILSPFISFDFFCYTSLYFLYLLPLQVLRSIFSKLHIQCASGGLSSTSLHA